VSKRVRPFGQLYLSLDDGGEATSSDDVVRPRRKTGSSRSRVRYGRLGSRVAVGEEGSDRRVRACLHCQKPVALPQWLREEELQLHLCSAECRTAWAEEQADPTVEVGTKSWTRGGNWESQKTRARERDGFACRSCGVTEEDLGGRLHVHHRIPYGHFRSNVEANKLEHLISVCPVCHGQLEAELRKELPLFNR
jgi:5-methylcytosine-specific restriction endonuclease McrA